MSSPPLFLNDATWSVIFISGVVLSVFFIRTMLSLFLKKPEEMPPLPRLSAFSMLSFLSGLGVLAMLLAIMILSLCQRYDVLLGVDGRDLLRISLARTIVIYCSIAPALAAVGFALAARLSVKEGNGAVRGKAYYRAGVIMALLSGLAFLAG